MRVLCGGAAVAAQGRQGGRKQLPGRAAGGAAQHAHDVCARRAGAPRQCLVRSILLSGYWVQAACCRSLASSSCLALLTAF